MKRLSFVGFLIPVVLIAQPASQSLRGRPSGHTEQPSAMTRQGEDADAFAQPANETAGVHVLQAGQRGVTCRAATEAEAQRIHDRDPNEVLKFIKGGDLLPKAQATGLTISLRGTTQLDSYPEAKAAFIRAASRWEAVIEDPISIIIDVDFGPQRFGTPYPSANILGSTTADMRQGPYATLRTAMLAKFPSSALYLKLPTTSVPTDHGNATTTDATSATLRTLRVLPSAQAEGDTAPSIGFNSAQPFDFDPTDGITTGEYDFDAVVTHEMGHVLGFDSLVGDLELHPADTLAVSSWDLFRFRSGITLTTFTSTQRVLASGGDQFFFDGVNQVPLSTGRVEDGSHGDGFQASHWKDVSLLGSYIGIMIPAIPTGARAYMTGWDLDALSWVGYDIANASYNAAELTSVSPSSVSVAGAEFNLTVTGSNFASGASVLWKGSPRPTTLVSSSQVIAQIPGSDIASGGAASIEVVNPGAIPSNTLYVSIGSPANVCTPSSMNLCLSGSRFSVTADWRKSDGTSGQGTAVPLTSDTGYFWFFDPTNIEVITKVLNGCSVTNAYWVFAAGLTNVEVTLTYTDTNTQTSKPYVNVLGNAFAPIQDTAAFATCP